MIENIDYSEEWLIQKLIKQYEEDKDKTITIKKIDLYRFVIKFIKLNKEE